MRAGIFAGLFLLCSVLQGPASAQPIEMAGAGIQSITLEGGPIASKHFQHGPEDYNEHHVLAVMKVATEDYGNWALYFLNPNSVDDTSFGLGYVTDPYAVPVGPTRIELSGAIGLVTGYQDYPVPLVAGEARLVVYERGPWNAGVTVAAMPYYMENDETGDHEPGIVGTTPFLSIRYSFD